MSVDLATIAHPRLDGPKVRCAFNSRQCTDMVQGAGGFQEHHPWPKSMGGAEKQEMLVLCPNHHVRQHSLIRAMVEGTATHEVTRRFRPREIVSARAAVRLWEYAGKPAVEGWPTPAATA